MFFFSKTLIYSLLLWASNYLYETTTLCELTNYRHNVNISLDKKYKGLFKGGVNHGIEHDYMGLKERIMNLENEDDNCFGERLNALVNDDYFRKQFNKLIHGDEFQTKIDELIKNGKFEKPFKSLDLGNNYEEMFNDLENYHNFEENMNPFKNHNNLEEYFDELKRINDYINEQNDELANVNNYYRSFPDLTKYDDHLDIEYTAEKQRYMDEVEYDCIINKRKKSKFSKILKKLDMKIYKFLRKMNSKLESELIRYINMKYFNRRCFVKYNMSIDKYFSYFINKYRVFTPPAFLLNTFFVIAYIAFFTSLANPFSIGVALGFSSMITFYTGLIYIYKYRNLKKKGKMLIPKI